MPSIEWEQEQRRRRLEPQGGTPTDHCEEGAGTSNASTVLRDAAARGPAHRHPPPEVRAKAPRSTRAQTVLSRAASMGSAAQHRPPAARVTLQRQTFTKRREREPQTTTQLDRRHRWGQPRYRRPDPEREKELTYEIEIDQPHAAEYDRDVTIYPVSDLYADEYRFTTLADHGQMNVRVRDVFDYPGTET